MKLNPLAAVIAALLSSTALSQDELWDCGSASLCLAAATAAYEAGQWAKAEELARNTMDLAEPHLEMSSIASKAYLLAANASYKTQRPRQAFAWSEVAVRHLESLEGRLPAAQVREVKGLARKLERVVDALPRDLSPGGVFIRYVGRGEWNTITLIQGRHNKVTWRLDALRPGNADEPVFERGPAQVSNGLPYQGRHEGTSIRGHFPDYYAQNKLCPITFKLSAKGLEVNSPACAINHMGTFGSPDYLRTEGNPQPYISED